jgi:hypothetical protein
MMKSLESSKYLRPVTLAEILTAEKTVGSKIYESNKRSKVYPLWQRRFMSFPEDWLTPFPIKGKIRSAALLVSLILWQQYRLNRGKQPLKLTGTMRRKFVLNRAQVRRALIALEKCGLITMQKFKHRSPLITLVTEQKLNEDCR